MIPLFVYGILLIISTILGYLENYPEQVVTNKLYLDFKLQTLNKMKTIDYLEYQKVGTGRLMQIVEDGATASRDALLNFWLKLIRYLIPMAFFSLFFIFKVKRELAILVIFGYVIVILISNTLLKKLYKLKEKILFNQEILNKHLVRGFMELVVFRTNKKYETEIKITEKGIKNIVDGKTKIKLVHEIFFSAFALIVNMFKVIILGYSVLKLDITVGSIVTVISLLDKAYLPIAIFNVEYVDYKLNQVAIKKYVDFLELKDDLGFEKTKKMKKMKGSIVFDNVSFSYASKGILNKLTLKINSNSSIALVGESGSGKSTIVKLLMGLIKPKEGRVLIDGKDLNSLNLDYFYEQVTYISQESPIFDGSLRENLVFDKMVTDDEIIKVLDLVCLKDFYQKLEKGLDTELGEKGLKLSGGERQRIALARLFFEESRIVILDEATSALDNLTETKVMDSIFKTLNSKTFVIIAHRLESIKKVDQIYVLSNGKIVEKGNYYELLNNKKYFSKLCKALLE